MERDCKGIWIPIDIWLNLDLTGNEKIVLFEIDSFTKNGQPCYLSDSYLARLLGVSVRSANRTVNSLIKKGFVSNEGFDGRHRFLQSRLDAPVRAGKTKLSEQTRQDCHKIYNKRYISNDNKDESKLSSSALTQVTEQTPKKVKVIKFKKPSVEEIRHYCQERGNSVDPEKFFNFYESKGWVVGKSPMKDWKAAVRTWEQRPDTPIKTPSRKKSVFEQNIEVIDQMYGTDMHSQIFGEEVCDER